MRSPFLTPAVAAAAVFIAGAGCKESPAEPAGPRVETLRISRPGAPLALGDTLCLEAVALTADESAIPGTTVRWSSSNNAVAPVDSLTGFVYAADTGTVYIRAVSGGVSSPAVDPHVRPRRVAISATLTSVAVGSDHACGLTAAGAAYCWGSNGSGQRGTGVPIGATTAVPAVVPAPGTFTALAGSPIGSMCALGVDSLAYCWGHNGAHQLGRTPVAHADPVVRPVDGSPRFRSITVGVGGGCGLTAAGEAYCWGGTPDPGSRIPAQAFPGTTFLALDAGYNFRCGVRTVDAPGCWGFSPGLFGDNFSHPFVPFSLAPPYADIRAGDDHFCGLTAVGADSKTYCWGFIQ